MSQNGASALGSGALGDDARSTLLLIEDNPGDASLLREALSEPSARSFDIVHVETLGEGLDRLESGAIDIVATDLNLPDGAGRATFEHLRAAAPHLPIVILTGRDDKQLALELGQEGAQDYIVKGELNGPAVARCLEYALLRKSIEGTLEASRQEALQASHAKSTFLAAMTHEIRTPLTAIIGMADLLSETTLNGEQRQYLEIFRRCGTSLLGLLNNVLELARLESNGAEPLVEDVDLNDMVADTVELFAFNAHSRGLSIAYEIDPDVPAAVRSDPNRIRQVLANLVGNAIKFTSEGEVVVRVSRAPVADGPGDELVFEVQDSGIGIPSEQQEVVFARFVQAHDSVRGGAGLGLTICKEVVERMGGRIGVRSRLQTGSTFFFSVPLQPSRGGSGAGRLERGPALQECRVLMVDDHDAERRIMATALARCGARVAERGSLKEALATLEGAKERGRGFDVAVLDCRMPGGGGFEVVSWLKEHPGLVARTVMLLPMDHRVGDVEACRRLGAEPLVKPARPADLVRAVAGAAEEADDRAEAAGPAPTAEGSLRGLRILVAEDSPDNRVVILAYLRSLGCEVLMVKDGAAAVERVASEDVDLVLMDVQMPVMDGLTATREIRRLEAESGAAHLPILALTAYSYPEQAQACLAAGCDLHLVKPLEKPKLLAAIQHFADAPIEPISVDPDLTDLVPDYLARRRQDVARGRELLVAGDFEQLARMGHDMKGSGAAYGFPRITRIGRDLEQAGQGRDPGRAGQRLAELERHLDKIEAASQHGKPDPTSG